MCFHPTAFFLSIGRFRYRKGILEGWSFYVYKGTEKDNSKKMLKYLVVTENKCTFALA